MKFAKQLAEEWHHGSYKKLWILIVDELPLCNECNIPIENETFIWFCVTNNKFYHYDCFKILDHYHTFKEGQHIDDICRIRLNPSLFQKTS